MYNVSFCKKLCSLSSPLAMGIVNVTPDSFFTSVGSDVDVMLSLIDSHLSDGAQIIDIGGCSTRPGGEFVSADEEWRRIDKALAAVRQHFGDIVVSVDTFRASVAERSVRDYDVALINDVYGGEADGDMFATVGRLEVPYVLTFGSQIDPALDGNALIATTIDFFARKIAELKTYGVKDIILDPGFGFGKTLDQNYCLLQRLDELHILGFPLLVGVSHKSMIYRLLGVTPQETDEPTVALEVLAAERGADIVRTHRVGAWMDAMKMLNKLSSYK